METKWSIAALLLVVAGSATCYITCSNGKVCSDQSTCCLTDQGYECCPVPNAVCCPDMAHCCPPGFRCDITTQMCERENRPQSIIPTLRKMAAKEPNSPISPPHEFDSSPVPSDVTESSAGALVQCDNGRCCLDGNHCCPSGFDCDFSFSKCVRNDNLRYPFVRMQKPSVMEAIKVSKLAGKVHDQDVPLTGLLPASNDTPQPGVIHCDTKFYCPPGNSCCKRPTGQWGCCSYPLGQCCADGNHCCQYGYVCDSTSSKCTKGYIQIPSSLKDEAKQY